MRSSCVHSVLTNWQYHRVHRLLILFRDGGEAKNGLAHDQVHDVEYREVDKKCVEWRPHFWPKDKMHSFEVSVVASHGRQLGDFCKQVHKLACLQTWLVSAIFSLFVSQPHF